MDARKGCTSASFKSSNRSKYGVEVKTVDLKQSEIEKLMKQLSKAKKLHAVELERLEQTALYQKQLATTTEQAITGYASERAKMLESIRLLEDKALLLEKTMELEKLQHAEILQTEHLKHKEERRSWEEEVLNAKHMAELSQQRVEEAKAEEMRKCKNDKKLHEAEVVISETVHQQFEGLRASTNPRFWMNYPKR